MKITYFTIAKEQGMLTAYYTKSNSDDLRKLFNSYVQKIN